MLDAHHNHSMFAVFYLCVWFFFTFSLTLRLGKGTQDRTMIYNVATKWGPLNERNFARKKIELVHRKSPECYLNGEKNVSICMASMNGRNRTALKIE